MKNLVFLSLFAVVLFSCNSKQSTEVNADASTKMTASADVPSFGLDELLNVADQYIDKTVIIEGHVTHTCKHAGKRCFIIGESKNVSMRIEAKGEIGGFNRELVGSKIRVVGPVKERRLSLEYIDQMEKDVNVKKAEDGNAESCEAELSNINDMRQWMKDNNKDYYSIFFMDGQEYEVVE